MRPLHPRVLEATLEKLADSSDLQSALEDYIIDECSRKDDLIEEIDRIIFSIINAVEIDQYQAACDNAADRAIDEAKSG